MPSSFWGLSKTLIILSLLIGASTAMALQQAAPIVKPGAPGEPSRQISAEESIAMGNTDFTAADAKFMQHMIVHHAQAVEMVSLIAARTENENLLAFATRIRLSQDAEIGMMRRWLERREQPLEDPNMHAGHDMGDMDMPMMMGMLSPAQMEALRLASGEEFDRLFLTGMIQHHEGALTMVRELRKDQQNGLDLEVAEFLTAVDADQSMEILLMQSMLAAMEN